MSVSTSERIQSYSRILNKKTKPKPCFNLLRDNTFLCNYKIMSQLNHLEKKKRKKKKTHTHLMCHTKAFLAHFLKYKKLNSKDNYLLFTVTTDLRHASIKQTKQQAQLHGLKEKKKCHQAVSCPAMKAAEWIIRMPCLLLLWPSGSGPHHPSLCLGVAGGGYTGIIFEFSPRTPATNTHDAYKPGSQNRYVRRN